MKKYPLDAEEKEIEGALESGKIQPLSNSASEKLRLQNIAKAQKNNVKKNNRHILAKVR